MTKGRLGKNWNNNVDQINEGSMFKGLFYGLAFSIPVWIIIFMVVDFI